MGLWDFLVFLRLDFGTLGLFAFLTFGLWDFGKFGHLDFGTFGLWDLVLFDNSERQNATGNFLSIENAKSNF